MRARHWSLFVGLLVLLSAPAQAQPIHGYSGKTFYASPAEYPFVSAQGHWTAPGLNMGMTAHTHVECTTPLASETTTATIDVACRVLLFHTAGRVTRVGPRLISKIVWQATGTTTPPVMRGDPTGIVSFNFVATMDPNMGDPAIPESSAFNVPVHGWWHPSILVATTYDNGDATTVQLMMPMWSVKDPSQPVPWWGSKPEFSSRVSGGSPRNTKSFGTQISQYPVIPPILAPLTAPVSMTVISSSYAHTLPPTTPRGTSRMTADLDFHNGIPGRVLFEKITGIVGGDPNGQPITFDPVMLGPGAHKVAISWDQTTDANTTGFEAGQELTSLLVVTVTVGGSVTPNLCVTDPLTAQVDVTANHTIASWKGFVTVTDDRGCAVTVSQ